MKTDDEFDAVRWLLKLVLLNLLALPVLAVVLGLVVRLFRWAAGF